MSTTPASFVLFLGPKRLLRGSLAQVALAAKTQQDLQPAQRIALFDERDGAAFDVDLRGTEDEILTRLAAHPLAEPAAPKPGPGRPKLGVVSREISLLPRHWQWLRGQRGGASAALRKLVDEARSTPDDMARVAIDAAHKFMWDIAGDQPDFEAASRALYAGDFAAFDQHITDWPTDIADQLCHFTQPARELEAGRQD